MVEWNNCSNNWEISFIELVQDGKIRYKVTRRLPLFSVSETKIFLSKKAARKQLEEWLG